MKQKSFIKHLRKHNCILDDEGAKHSKFINEDNFLGISGLYIGLF